MKKLLALVLALVMTLSLCTISNAAYSDAADVDYKEAVDVMTAAGVFNGADGKFNPKGILTREQAAKIVTYMLLGKTAADALVTIAAPFSDVAADRWSAGSIAYCYNEGILAGVGEGKFAPEAQLTGLAFAKMMLVALGYDAEVEGLTGANWSINVAKLALTTGLTDDIEDVSLAAPMSRELAAKMAFNTELTTMVEYDNQSTITAGNVTIKTQSAAKKVTGGSAAYDALACGEDDVCEFAEKYATKLIYDGTGETDSYGRPAHTWYFGKVANSDTKVGTYADKADLVYTSYVSVADMTKALKNLKIDADANVTIYKNAATYTTATITANTAITTADDTIQALTGNGNTVEIFINADKEIYAVVQIAPVDGEVTSVTATKETKNHGAYTTYAVGGLSGKVYSTVVDEDDDTDTAIVKGDVAKKDWVTYYKNKSGKLVITKATEMTGTLKTITSASAPANLLYNVDGTGYKLAACGDAPTINTKKAQNFYMDEFGYILKSFTTVDDTTYAFVVPGTVKDAYVADEDNTLTGIVRAYLVFTDGSIENVTVYGDKADWEAREGNVITYTVNDDNEYVAGAPAAGRTVGFDALTDNQATIGTLRANNSTVYYVMDYTEKDGAYKFAGTAKSYTGYKNVPVYAALGIDGITCYALDTTKNGDSIADVVFIADHDATASTIGSFVYVKGTYTQTGAAKFVFDTIVKGKDATATVGANNTLVGDTLYSVINTSTTTYTKAEDDGNVLTGTNAQNKGGLLYVDGLYIDTVKDDVAVYTFNTEDDSVVVGTAADLATKAEPLNGNVYVEWNASGDVAAIYVLAREEGDLSTAANFDADAVKAAPDGMYTLSSAPSDVADFTNDKASDVRVFKWTGVGSQTYTLTIKNSSGVTKYAETTDTMAEGGHFFYIQVTGAHVDNNNNATTDLNTALTAGTYTWEIKGADNDVYGTGIFVID